MTHIYLYYCLYGWLIRDFKKIPLELFGTEFYILNESI